MLSFLPGGRERLAALYASKAEEKFEGIGWRSPETPEGGPILHDDSAAYAVCVTRQAIEAGDHWVFIGEVHEVATIPGRFPLLSHRRAHPAVVDGAHLEAALPWTRPRAGREN